MQEKIYVIGVASGIAAKDQGCGQGPEVLWKSAAMRQLSAQNLSLEWMDILYRPKPAETDKFTVIVELCEQVASYVQTTVEDGRIFLTLGGDHSCAVGTWSGAAMARQNDGPIGLIWIDAHMDSHTPETTESGFIHGMPLAALLGYGNPGLTQVGYSEPKLHPEHVCLIGVRSYESGEAALLERLGVQIFYMEDIEKRGLYDVIHEAIKIVTNGTIGYGISIDLDAIDPEEAPGVGSPEPHGIHVIDLYQALKQVQPDFRLIGAEIAEFNPERDIEHRTETVVAELIHAMFTTVS